MTSAVLRIAPLRRNPGDRTDQLRTRPEHGPPRCFVEQLVQSVRKQPVIWLIFVVTATSLALQLGVGVHLHHWLYG